MSVNNLSGCKRLVHRVYCCFHRRDLDKKIERSRLKQQQMEQAMAVWCDKLTNYRKIVSIGLSLTC